MRHLPYALLHSLGFTQRKLRDILVEDAGFIYEHLNAKTLLGRGFQLDTIDKIVDKKTEKFVEHVEQTLTRLCVKIVHRDDEDFPSLLRELPDSPTILYVRGSPPPNDALISIVGSRKHSQYAISCLEKIIPDLIRAGYGVISWGAYGIDSVAHEITLKNNGYTAAVFGSGIDLYYPPANEALFDRIVGAWGALISQFPLWMIAEPYNFPIRNAIVAGMSRGTLIAEAREDSGTLITARLALEANRDVFVIPADITRTGALGSNSLIRDGLGKLITSTEDILSEYQVVDRQLSLLSTMRPDFTDQIQESLYEILCRDSVDIDTLSQILQLDSQAIMTALAMMEIEGIVTSTGGVYRVR
jgi:DNA processing protein